MKKIKIKDYTELEVREAKCDFCGEVSECVKGNKNPLLCHNFERKTVRALKDTYYVGKLKKVYDIPDLHFSMFGSDYYKDDDKRFEFIFKKDDLEYKTLYEKTGETVYVSYICKNCIKQLAKLV
jgi:hypothetical protein